MPYAIGCVLSNVTLRVDPGHQNSFVVLPVRTLRTPMPSRSTGNAAAPFNVTSVPPFCTKSRIALTPSVPMPVRYSGGVLPPRPPPPPSPPRPPPPPSPPPRPPRPPAAPPAAVSPTIVLVLSLGITSTSYLALRLPALISGSRIDVYGKLNCSSTNRVQPSSILPQP